jgi:hypothetical protein
MQSSLDNTDVCVDTGLLRPGAGSGPFPVAQAPVAHAPMTISGGHRSTRSTCHETAQFADRDA